MFTVHAFMRVLVCGCLGTRERARSTRCWQLPPPAALTRCRYEAAANDCSKAVEVDSSFVKAYNRGGKAWLSLGDFEHARAFLERGMVQHPREEAIRVDRNQVIAAEKQWHGIQHYVSAHQYKEALLAASRLAKTTPAFLELHLLRAEALLGMKKLDEALTITTELLTGRKAHGAGADAEKPSELVGTVSAASAAPGGVRDGRLLVLRARILNAQGNTTAAITHLQEALRIDMDNSAAAKLVRLIRKQDSTKTAANEHFKAGRMKVRAATAAAWQK